MVGLMAEPLPKGFGFSETAFRIFILMASRRLKSDRFLSTDYRPEVYTQAGLRLGREDDDDRHPHAALPGVKPALCRHRAARSIPWRRQVKE